MIGAVAAILSAPRQVQAALDDASLAVPWAQNEYVRAKARWNVVVCSRRAGKTAGAIRRATERLLAPGSRVLYIHVRLKLARDQFWGPILDYARGRSIAGAERHDVMQLSLRNGSFLRVDACQDIGDLAKFRGDQWDLILLDEVQEHDESVVSALIDQCLMPSLGDRRGGLDILGTPPPEGAVGYLYDRFEEAQATGSRWRSWHWTMRENPYYPAEEIDALCAARGIGPGHPVYEREFAGRFVSDQGLLVYEYESPRNDATDAHAHTPGWYYSMGIDLGFSDRDAIIVLGWRSDDAKRRIRECFAWQQNHQDVDQLSKIVLDTYAKYHPVSVIGDTGGHGAVKVLETLKARLGGIEFSPKPASVDDSVAIMNDDFRNGRMLADPGGELVADYKRVVWDVKNGKRKIGAKYHSDITEAARYAHWGAWHYAAKAPRIPVPTNENEAWEQKYLARASQKSQLKNRWERRL